jgi:multiple sugar transport system substrate-binding protein
MKNRSYLLFAVLLIGAFILNACAPTAAPTSAPPAAQTEAPTAATGAQAQPVTVEYWAFADYASGAAGDLQKTFIAEFEAANPGVKINMSPKNDDELTAGITAAAASKTLPDIYMQSDDMGANDVQLGALDNVYDRWMAEPEAFRSQFNPVMVADMTPIEKTMYGMPYTGYSSFLFRNLTVLKAAGIDPAEKVETWDQWLAQMKKIKDSGNQALPSMALAYNDFVAMYAGVANENEWGIDWANKKTLLNPEKYAELVKFQIAAKEYGTDIGNRDQAAQDLFLSNKLAYRISGPWTNVTFADAKKSNNLDYDFVVVPGITADNAAGHRGTEFIALAPDGKNKDIAWKFVMYICDEPQMTRWAKLLSRYNSNQVTLSKVDDPLLQITTEGAKSALLVQPPDFIKAYPAGYTQAILDNMAAIESGQFTPEEGGQKLVETLNKLIQETQ